jgi:hypothetical protein
MLCELAFILPLLESLLRKDQDGLYWLVSRRLLGVKFQVNAKDAGGPMPSTYLKPSEI